MKTPLSLAVVSAMVLALVSQAPVASGVRILSEDSNGVVSAVDSAAHARNLRDLRAQSSTYSNDTSTACLPQFDADFQAREAAVAAANAGYVYGPSLIGQASFFPNGTLGNARVADDMALWGLDRAVIDAAVQADVAAVTAAIMANGGLRTLDDYANVLYKDQWRASNPRGTAPGIMSNYTSDLLFSMERLSQNPFPLVLVKPTDRLPFAVEDDIAIAVAGATLAQLQASSSLFMVDHSGQARLQITPLPPQRYGAPCTAYFFIHPTSGDFLPLAIKTNTGSDLVYTPLDAPAEWLFAKMTFNVADFFFAQMFHLTVTHDLSEGVHLAALRTLSERHPIMILLERMMLQGYSSRVVGEELCFNPGGHWDQLFVISNVGCRQFVSETWPVRGAYQAAYLQNDLQGRGLIDANGTYRFKSFPFYEDASVIRDAQEAFFAEVVDSYYPTEQELANDGELQMWFKEVSQGAAVYDFPASPVAAKQTLVDVLTHFAFIVGVVHHALNSGDPMGSKATLPFHPNALFAPLPTAKGQIRSEADIVPFLPPPPNAVHYIGFLATFNRPFYAATHRVLEEAFSAAAEPQLLRLNARTTVAAEAFMQKMQQLSEEIHARTFDADGLSEGMPFVYRTLDPAYIPFFCSV